MPTLPLSAAGQIALAAGLAAVAFALLLPRPRGRSVSGGVAAAVASVAVFALYLVQAYGKPSANVVETILFALFSLGAVGFGTVTVTQRNPARGAIAFSFVVLSTCGLFLLLAAPFLMAATVIIYAGAIVVTFLFVLMLSHAGGGPTDENDRTREPLLGGLGGFAFVGLVLFTVHQSLVAPPADAADPKAKPRSPLPAVVLTAAERAKLSDVVGDLQTTADGVDAAAAVGPNAAANAQKWLDRLQAEAGAIEAVARAVGERMKDYRHDAQADAVQDRAAALDKAQQETFRRAEGAVVEHPRKPLNAAAVKSDVHRLRDDVRLMLGVAELPARNVGNLGLLLYADHLLAVELAGTLLLVATIGTVAVAGRKGDVVA